MGGGEDLYFVDVSDFRVEAVLVTDLATMCSDAFVKGYFNFSYVYSGNSKITAGPCIHESNILQDFSTLFPWKLLQAKRSYESGFGAQGHRWRPVECSRLLRWWRRRRLSVVQILGALIGHRSWRGLFRGRRRLL